MNERKRKEIQALPNADDNKNHRLNHWHEERLLKYHIEDIHKKLQEYKEQYSKLDWANFEGNYSEFMKEQHRLEFLISEQEREIVETNDMWLLHEKDIPCEDFGLNSRQAQAWIHADCFEGSRGQNLADKDTNS